MNQSVPAGRDVSERTREIVKTFNLPQRILYALSKDPQVHFMGEDEPLRDHASNLGDPLRGLRREFPDVEDLILGKSVLDYGCGSGWQAITMAKLGASYVFGLDINEATIEFAQKFHHVENVTFSTKISGKFDVAISLNSFEHFPHPESNLDEIKHALKPGGKLLLTFCPPWFAPYGSHIMFSYCPWVNILFSEKTVFKVRELYREDVLLNYRGVNKMTIKRFERIIAESGFKIIRLRYTAVKKLPLVTRIPYVRELLTNVVTCILEKP